MENYDIIIIGGGPAGYTAALYASRAGLSTLVIEKMSIGGQMALTDIIDNYPGFDEGIDGITLGMKMQAGAERFGAVTVYDEVIDLELHRAHNMEAVAAHQVVYFRHRATRAVVNGQYAIAAKAAVNSFENVFEACKIHN